MGEMSRATQKARKTCPPLVRNLISLHMQRMELSLTFTLILAIVFGLFTALFGFLGARPMNPNRGPRMVPWRFLMLLTFTAALLLVVHLLNLLGIQTKAPERY